VDAVAYDAIVLTGGRGSRLGGADKAALTVGGLTLLERVLRAVSEAGRVLTVGPQVSGGPVAAVANGLAQSDADVVVVLACDLPFLTGTTVRRLVSAVGETDGAVLVDAGRRRQYLAAVYTRAALLDAVHRLPRTEGASMHDLVEGLRLTEVRSQSEEAADCDTWADVARARALLEER
jgi:molybdopterin-guanine dinucleotide biosynthesis protein A